MGARSDQKCSICSSNPDVVRAVETALQNKQKLDDLSRESGFSRSALSRHSRRHMLRHALHQNRETRHLNLADCRLVVEWPAVPGFARHMFTLQCECDHRGNAIEPPRGQGVIELTADELRESDILLRVTFENPTPQRIPTGMPVARFSETA